MKSKKSDGVLINLAKFLSFNPSELRLYQKISEKPMTISQIKKNMDFSERMIRTYLKDLTKRGFIKRRIIESDRLKYVYYASPEDSIIDVIKKRIEARKTLGEIARVRIKKNIIEGVERH